LNLYTSVIPDAEGDPGSFDMDKGPG